MEAHQTDFSSSQGTKNSNQTEAMHEASRASLEENHKLKYYNLNYLLKMGALKRGHRIHLHDAWRLLSYMWVHAGLFHLINNTISFMFLSVPLDICFGSIRLGAIYIASGVGAGSFSQAFHSHGVSAGSSGACYGLYGAIIADLVVNRSLYTNDNDKCKALWMAISIAAFDLVFGPINSHVGFFGQLGGIITGLLVGMILLPKQSNRTFLRYQWISVTLLAFGLLLGLSMFL